MERVAQPQTNLEVLPLLLDNLKDLLGGVEDDEADDDKVEEGGTERPLVAEHTEHRRRQDTSLTKRCQGREKRRGR